MCVCVFVSPTSLNIMPNCPAIWTSRKRSTEKLRQIHTNRASNKSNGFQFYVKKWNIHWQQFQKEKWCPSKQLKQAHHQHKHTIQLCPYCCLDCIVAVEAFFLFVACSLSIKWDVDVLWSETNKQIEMKTETMNTQSQHYFVRHILHGIVSTGRMSLCNRGIKDKALGLWWMRARDGDQKRAHTHTGYLCLFFIYEDPINMIKSRTILFSHISPVILIYVSMLCLHYILAVLIIEIWNKTRANTMHTHTEMNRKRARERERESG